ncbi:MULTISPECIES: DUF397 domain-containing protein [unclassified Streptomyces]|uniref:DUF397 domain-containing protein n=1 Tax=unclassified Streptomyces TaxID=2593676 RepID=UPI000BF7B232|nr:DUF397 domain-containing protein [Streptomyces sp. Ru87]PGH48869.1 DUF397 domain-containing protein [Streptomyces sp. Ru87]
MNDLTWFKSSYSDSSGGECVEVAVRPDDAVCVRDSKRGDRGPVFRVGPGAWASFVGFAADSADV